MTPLISAWQALWQTLETVHADPQLLFRSGASREDLDRLEHALDRLLPAEVVEWFGQVDGQTLEVSSGPVLGMALMSIEETLATWTNLSDAAALPSWLERPLSCLPAGWVHSTPYSKGWIPLAHDFGSGYLLVDLEPDVHGLVGQVFLLDLDSDIRIVLAESLAALLQLSRQLIMKGALQGRTRPGGYWSFEFVEAGETEGLLVEHAPRWALERRIPFRNS